MRSNELDHDASDWEPEEGEEVRADDPRVRVLPPAEEVFVADQPWLADVLRPLVQVDLAALDPSWSGWLTLVDAVEPVWDVQEGVGGETDEFHDDHATLFWMAFALEGDRLRFLGRRQFFLHEVAREQGTLAGSVIEAHYRADAQDREECARGWRKNGKLRRKRRKDAVLTLGGDLWEGNWTTMDLPGAYRLVEGDEAPSVTTADGRPFRLVAQTDLWEWSSEAVSSLVVLFEPTSRTVLVTFEY